MDEKKVREAIELLKTDIVGYDDVILENSRDKLLCLDAVKTKEQLQTAIEALEKQLPKKVKIKDWCPSYCPSCGYELSEDLGDGYYRHPNFIERCPNPDCGQRLDWSEQS